ncbi:MAG: MmcB family DNA repair protein [Pseudomonadota bacterium]
MDTSPSLQPGQILARGVARYMRSLDFTSLLEFSPTRGRRVDVMAIGPKHEIWIIECKSSRADFQTDSKWQDYLEWCDRFYFAVPTDFPTEILPQDHGLIFADGYGAEIVKEGPDMPLAAARRKKLTHKVARDASDRLNRLVEMTGRYDILSAE